MIKFIKRHTASLISLGIIIFFIVLANVTSNTTKKSSYSTQIFTESIRLIADCRDGIIVENINLSDNIEEQGFIIRRDHKKNPITYTPLTTRNHKRKTVTAPITGGLYELPNTKNKVAILPDTIYDQADSINYDNYAYDQIIKNDLIKDQLIDMQQKAGCNSNIILDE